MSRSLAWKLNWWRQSELEGAFLLGRMVSHVADGELCRRLTVHCAEEAHHSQLWAETIAQLELPHVRIHRSYQALFLNYTPAPRSLVEVLAFTQVFEKRVHCRFHDELRRSDTPPAARRAFEQMIHDEKNHLAWVATWLTDQTEAGEQLHRFAKADEAVFAAIAPFEERLWDVHGLGTESLVEELA